MKTSDNPAIKRLVGAEGELGAAFGLDNEEFKNYQALVNWWRKL